MLRISFLKKQHAFLILLTGILFISNTIFAQGKLAFWNEVQSFKKIDSASFPKPNQILFIGSSSFVMWKDVQQYFPEYQILNRSFGGSTLIDQIRYRYDVIYPYNPKQIVLYCGENDLAYTDSVTAEMVTERLITLFRFIRDKYPNVPVAYVSIKPSPSRIHLFSKMQAANKAIESYLKKQKQTAFINVFDAMLSADGSPMTDIFLNDNLHMNAKGYSIWQKIIKPYLIR